MLSTQSTRGFEENRWKVGGKSPVKVLQKRNMLQDSVDTAAQQACSGVVGTGVWFSLVIISTTYLSFLLFIVGRFA